MVNKASPATPALRFRVETDAAVPSGDGQAGPASQCIGYRLSSNDIDAGTRPTKQKAETMMETVRLLVLDDDAMVAGVAVAMVEAIGGQGRVVTRTTELLKAIEEWQPTHIAVDLVMPDIDGVEVMNLLARRRCPARIIICSGMGGTVLEAAMRAAAGNGLDVAGVLPKPFSMRELKALLADAPRAPAGVAGLPVAATAATPLGASIGEAELRRAIRSDELFPVFMPKVDCTTGELVGFDVAARWRHPQLGIVKPGQFLPLAERAGLIEELTDSVFRQAMNWLGTTFPGSWLGLCLKLSAASLGSTNLVEILVAHCQHAELDCRRVTLELSEENAMADTFASLELLTRLRMKGFELSLGNFGVGYSSLAHLVRLPVSELKIDPSLASETRESRAIAKCVVDLALSLGIRVTISGVETPERLKHFSNIGCHYALGFYIAQPMEASVVAEWVTRWRESLTSRWEVLLLSDTSPHKQDAVLV
ncbi:MAG: EAL domain-containing response regulator [Nevskia sp.]